MSDKKGSNPFDEFDLLNMDKKSSPFGDNLEMEFEDETENVKSVNPADNTEKTESIIEEKEGSSKEETKKETKKEDKAVKEEKKEDKKEPSTEEESEDETEDKTEENPLQIFASFLNDKGVVNIEDGKKIESEDDLVGVIQNEIKSGIENYKNSMPDDAQKFFEFIEAGGNPRQFHKLYYEQRSWKDVDPTKENNQELIVREALELSGWDKEDIDAEIQDKKDLGKLESLAEKFHKKLIAGEDEDKKSLVEAQKEYKKRQDDLAKKEWEEFKDNLYKLEDLNGFKLTSKVKDDLWKYITQTDRKTGKTQLQQHNETNTKAQFLYAYLAMNNWDIEKLEKQVKTKVTNQLASKLSNHTDTRKKISSGQSDSFKDKKESKNNFSAFKTAIENNLF